MAFLLRETNKNAFNKLNLLHIVNDSTLCVYLYIINVFLLKSTKQDQIILM